MKVALVNPDNGRAIPKENLGLLSLATTLHSKGFDVRIIDEVAGDQTLPLLSAFHPDVVGISFMTMFANRAYDLVGQIRKNFDSVSIVLGGAHPSACPEEAIRYADAVVVGEAEVTLPELLEKGAGGAGIVQGSVIDDLNSLPMADRSLINVPFYMNARMGIAGTQLPALSMVTSRGCPFRCIFCRNSKRTAPVRTLSLDLVMAEIRHLVQIYGVESIAFVDENFAINRGRLLEFCRRLSTEPGVKLKWECQTSAHCIDEEMVEALKASGAVQVAFGFESGSQRMLEVIGKRSNVADNRRAIALCKAGGLKVRGCFILGNPTETAADIRQTQEFIRRNEIDYVGVFLATPLPGTLLWDYCVEHKLLDPATLDYDTFTTGTDVNICATTDINMVQLKRLYSETTIMAMRKNYGIVQLISRTIKYPDEALKVLAGLIRGK